MPKITDVRVKIAAVTYDLLDDGTDGEANDPIEYTTDGRLTEEDGRMELSYEESAELGMDDSITTLIFHSSNPKFINMSRSGGSTAGLCFNPDVPRQPCALSTQGLSLEFVINTRRVENTVSHLGGKIELDYTIEFHGCVTERNQFRIDVTPKPTEGQRA